MFSTSFKFSGERCNILDLKQVIKIQKYFRNVHQAHGWLKEKNDLIQISNEIRWNSHSESSLNYHKYREIVLEQDNEFDDSIANILNNMGIYNELIYLEKQSSCLSIECTAAKQHLYRRQSKCGLIY